MSLYHDAAPLLLRSPDQTGSLKSRVFNAKDLKSTPKQVFALVSEASKWSPILSEVIEKSQLLQLERKLSPNVALLLIHDLLLTKRGVSAPSSHPLRLAVERHKARLHAELTRARLRKGLASIEALRAQMNANNDGGTNGIILGTVPESEAKLGQWPHPRWVRVNTIKSDLDEQLRTTFAGYETIDSLEKMLRYPPSSAEKHIHVDKHVPNLLALPPGADLSKTPAYLNGQIILQDKASCFPAYLLYPKLEDCDCLDACAAPGNKTTHLAAILHDEGQAAARPKIYACERDKGRASTLLTLVQKAGAQDCVIAKVGLNFLKSDPAKTPWNGIGTLLLDPSCSGSGIVGRDETLHVVLPSKEPSDLLKLQSKKRKRQRKPMSVTTPTVHDVPEEIAFNEDKPPDQLSARLAALSTFQLKLLLHAFRFPKARKITYSTCSIYAEENEHVVMKALGSSIAQEQCWQILRREEQISGMKAWNIRGKLDACVDVAKDEKIAVAEVAEACIRCEKGTKEGTQGFFVAAFVRQVDSLGTEQLVDREWEGFSDSGIIS